MKPREMTDVRLAAVLRRMAIGFADSDATTPPTRTKRSSRPPVGWVAE